MAVISGTSSRHNLVGFREDLEDTIWDLFPEDTWALTNLDKLNATGTLHEWQADTLAGATANRQIEGDDAAYTTLAATVRYGNYVQTSRKTFIVSGIVEASKAAGRRSDIARAGMKLMRELKRDMEQALVGNQASSVGGAATARSSAGMEAMIQGPSTTAAGNAVLATSTASATTAPFASGVFSAPSDGTTTGAFTSVNLTNALQGAWTQGGNPRIILAGAGPKSTIDGFTSIATRFVDVDRNAQAVITGAANVYVSDFGKHTVVLHRYMRASVVLCLDPEYWAMAFLRRPFMEPLAKTGDAEKRQILTDFCLVGRNWLASSKVVAIT